MDFTLDDTRITLREVAAEVFRDAPSAAWPTLVTADMDVLSAMVVLTEAGRAATSLPGLALGVLPLARHGIEVPDGARVTAALHEPSDPMTSRPRTRAAGGVINGVKIGVPDAVGAHRILVPVSTDEGSAVALVDPASPGVTLNPAPTSSGFPEFSLHLVDAPYERTFDGLADLHRLALAGACATADGLLAAALSSPGNTSPPASSSAGRWLPSRPSRSRSPTSTSRPEPCTWPPGRRAGGWPRDWTPSPMWT